MNSTRVVTPDDVARIVRSRVKEPGRIAELATTRLRPSSLDGQTGRLVIVAADHPARGSLRAGPDPLAMGDRADLLDRMVRALSRPGVDGVLGTADVIEDLLLLGALDGKVVFGSMNRGGLAGTTFEMDDRFTGSTAGAIHLAGYQGGKMLLRVDPADPSSVSTLQACAHAVGDLAARGLVAMVEPFISGRDEQGRVHNDLSTEAVIRSATIAAGLASTSAYTWLKLPVVQDMEAVVAATTLPVLLLGGEVSDDQGTQMASWAKALASPSVRGMVVGRSLLFPPGGDVEAAVDATVEMM
jgi:DhnA family fructose-bisphosphate aldolase class Ia